MADSKKWNPFRFKRDRNRSARLPAPAPRSLPALRDEMERMFERFWTMPFAIDASDRWASDRWFGDFSAPEFQPKLDVTDDKNCLRVAVEVPGVDAGDLHVDVQDGVLSLSGEKRHEEASEDEGCYRTERSYGCFQRTIPLPTDVDGAKADARFDKGVLRITLPKTERAKSQSVKVAIKA